MDRPICKPGEYDDLPPKRRRPNRDRRDERWRQVPIEAEPASRRGWMAYLWVVLILALGGGVAWRYAVTHRSRDAHPVAVRTETRYATAPLHVRSLPNTQAAILHTLQRGEAVQVGATDGNHWTRIFTSDGKPLGWVHGGFLQELPPAAVQTTVAAATPRQPAEPVPLSTARPVTAICRDGSSSYAEHHQGACANHDGVATFLR